ncbi:MAG: hypothetical protein L0221_01260 [Chloroflexi bacterium]|nr:hypothetical protein [Chloroflexota bacterium]
MTEPQRPAQPGDTPTTSPGPPAAPQLPPDPAAYDHPRAVHARARGLSAPYIAGGRDPEPERGRAEERRYLRLLIAMVAVLVLSGFVLGVVQNLLGTR